MASMQRSCALYGQALPGARQWLRRPLQAAAINPCYSFIRRRVMWQVARLLYYVRDFKKWPSPRRVASPPRW
jgi:hypothetical protein